jgi:hypothetical protein
MSQQSCPICGVIQRANPRYPRYLCRECADQAVDETGRRLHFTSLGCGFQASYADTDELRDSHVCFVRGVRCWADEAHFGGIVIQTRDASHAA